MKRDVVTTSLIGLTLALAIMATWASLHILTLFAWRSWPSPFLALPVFMLLSWLSVGLFIVGHDAMHGSLTPAWPAAGRALGALALLLYANFSYRTLRAKHFDHHTYAGLTGDPDSSAPPRRFWPWYATFMRTYFGVRQALWMAARVALYLLLGAPPINILVFYAAASLAASLQLFYFGTYLPHRHGDDAFADRHNARSQTLGWGFSLLSCFHFGQHHEHHLAPGVPWWRLHGWRRR